MIMGLYGKTLMLNLHLAMFNSEEYVIEGSYDIMGRSSSFYVTILSSLLSIDIVVVEI